MEGELYANITLLQQHTAEVQQERQTATELHEQLVRAKGYADPALAYRYDRLIRQADGLVRYFHEMEDAVDNMSTDFLRLSRHIRSMLEDNLYWSR